jgi:glucokinase
LPAGRVPTRRIARGIRTDFIPLMYSPTMSGPWSIGADIGHTNTRVVMVVQGRAVKTLRFPTHVQGGPRGISEQVGAAIRTLREGETTAPLGVGVGIAGQVDIGRGVVRYGPNLWWADEPFEAMLAEAIGLPVTLRNDVVMATVGEWRHGAGKGARDLVCLFVGTGIGGGAVVNGALLNGSTGCGGHFGHISVQMDGPPCTCGRRGCVEAYAGGASVARRARAALEDPSIGPTLRYLSEGRPERIDSRLVAAAAAGGDPFALGVRDEMAAALSSAVASVINSFNPEKVVLGGAVLFGFPGLYDRVVEGSLALCLKPALNGLDIVPAALGDLSGAVGAATLALR